MLRSRFQTLVTKITQATAGRHFAAARRRRGWPLQLEPLELRLAPSTHVWTGGGISDHDNGAYVWSDDNNWQNEQPQGDPNAVLDFPTGLDGPYHSNEADYAFPLTIHSIVYHDAGFITYGFPEFNTLLRMSGDVVTGDPDTNSYDILYTDVQLTDGATHLFQTDGASQLMMNGDLGSGDSSVLSKIGTGTLVLGGDNQGYMGILSIEQGTVRLGVPNSLTSATTIAMPNAGALLDLNGGSYALNIAGDAQGNIDLGSGNLTLGGGLITEFHGLISGTGGLTLNNNRVTLFGSDTYSGPTLVNGGIFQVDAMSPNSPITVSATGQLSGRGQVGHLDVYGTVVPGDPPQEGGIGPGVLTVNGPVVFEPGSHFNGRLQGTHPGGMNGYDQIFATGPIDLTVNPSLLFTLNFTSAEGDTFTILHSNDHITGTFAGLPDGTVFPLNGRLFRINYTGNEVVLTHLPQFAPPVYYQVGSGRQPYALAVGDLNGDGIPDLVVANTNTYPGTVSVLQGNGDGTFQSLPTIILPTTPIAVAVGHFHDPNILDLAVTAYDPVNGAVVYVLLGNGDGTFQAPVAYPVGLNPSDVLVGDLTGAGTDDLVVFNQNDNGYHGSVSILYNNGDGTFQPSQPLTFPGYTISAVALADLGNGRLDLIVANEAGTYGYNSVVSVLVNQGTDADGHAVFRHDPSDDYPTLTGISSLAVGDFNGDNLPDVLVTDTFTQQVGVLLGNGDGTLQGTVIHTSLGDQFFGAVPAVAVGDFDGDGTLDITVPVSGGRQAVQYGKGDGTFGPPNYYNVNGSDGFSQPIAEVVADFNGDGAPDLAVLTGGPGPSNVGILLNTVPGGPAPHRGGHSPRYAPAAIDRAMGALLERAGSQGVTAAPPPGVCVIPIEGPASPWTIPPAPAPSQVDRFFAILVPDDLAPAPAGRRLLAVAALPARFAWQLDRENWLLQGLLPEGLSG
jgi:autotransporter-associated beta strand protein